MDRVEEILNDLDTYSRILCTASDKLNEARSALVRHQADGLTQARNEASDAENGALMDAYASGKINGKNQAERDVQIAVCLAADERLVTARTRQACAERTASLLQDAMNSKETDYKTLCYQIRARMAMADLLAAIRGTKIDEEVPF